MALRNPLKFLIIGSAEEADQQALSESIRESDSTAEVTIAADATRAQEILRDNSQDFDAVYITFKDAFSFMTVDSFAQIANESIRKKNGVLVLADAQPSSQIVINEAKITEKRTALEMWNLACDVKQAKSDENHHQNLIAECQARRKMREELMHLASAIKSSLTLAVIQLEKEINTMASSCFAQWSPNDRETFDQLVTSLRTAANTFSLTMSNEEAESFGAACSDFVAKTRACESDSSKACVLPVMFGVPAGFALFGALVVLALATNPIALGIAGAVALIALAVIITVAVTGYSSSIESDFISTSFEMSSIIKKNNLTEFAKDASGSLLFKPKREEAAPEPEDTETALLLSS